MLRQIPMTYSDREKRPTKKVGKIDMFDSDNTEIADQVIHDYVHSTIFWSR